MDKMSRPLRHGIELLAIYFVLTVVIIYLITLCGALQDRCDHLGVMLALSEQRENRLVNQIKEYKVREDRPVARAAEIFYREFMISGALTNPDCADIISQTMRSIEKQKLGRKP